MSNAKPKYLPSKEEAYLKQTGNKHRLVKGKGTKKNPFGKHTLTPKQQKRSKKTFNKIHLSDWW